LGVSGIYCLKDICWRIGVDLNLEMKWLVVRREVVG